MTNSCGTAEKKTHRLQIITPREVEKILSVWDKKDAKSKHLYLIMSIASERSSKFGISSNAAYLEAFINLNMDATDEQEADVIRSTIDRKELERVLNLKFYEEE